MASSTGSTPTARSTAKSNRASASGASTESNTGRKGTGADLDTRGLPRPGMPSMSLVPRLANSESRSAPASDHNSANSSREVSPVRPASRVASKDHSSSTRSSSRQKNSASSSPNRRINSSEAPVTSALSSTAVQNAFSQLSTPDLKQAVSDDNNPDAGDPDRTSMPPPRTSRRRSSITNGRRSSPASADTPKHSESEVAANISTKRTSVSPEDTRSSPTKTSFEDVGSSARRPSARATTTPSTTLETVQESSLPSTPMTDKADSSHPEKPSRSKAYESLQQAAESGSESGGNKSSGSKEETSKMSTTRPTGDILPQRSFTSLNSARGKLGDGSVRNMIVETETVSSIPQVSLGVGAGERGSSNRNDQSGTIRMKPSVETIRPKREKKKTTRKPTNVPGVASSKADIFEAKVASAIDDADVSDSDETFVYESNPPEPLPPRHRYHSRTPSTTSMASQAEQFATRSRLAPRDGNGVTVKRSMKFTNNYNSNLDGDVGDTDQRSVSGRGENTTHSGRHHHIARHGRGGAYPSLFDSDSPFPASQGQQPRSPRHHIGNGFRPSRRGFTPRSHPNYRTLGGPKSMSDEYTDDFDADGADDERTPLVASIRLARNRNGRRPGSASMRQMEYLEQRQKNCFSRYGGCIIASVLILILIGGAATFFASLTRPLLDVKVIKLSNVLASQQEVIVNVHVSAINPNIFPISIGNIDAHVFAQSPYVGSDKFWRDRGPHPEDFPRVERSKLRATLARLVRLPSSKAPEIASSSMVHTSDNVDHGTDPILDPDDPIGEDPSMMLGRVFKFDSPIIFDPSPWRRTLSTSMGEIRLPKPGNKTEEGGTERWERVLEHPFELIVRGVLKYSLPLTSSVRSIPINAKIHVSPNNDGNDDKDGDGDSTPNQPDNSTFYANTIKLAAHRATSTPISLGRMF
ncbi:putative phospholipid metabolism enzyme regulator [Talaromyces proteolyticus]|uniref:Phospholipid metabolism enzyme regulator n=1 Tax=Talaromyces proteolyticus TaxID=1131652 RepID=A0AAD4KM59_9EURO|nr:putative phospholipid metabolism enzyme regulator [Talaromyces proteolyticus]KAH8695967.1 putative phospholipid metabolism enzyme regulator [Talaromyces proteolyticus]